MQINKKTTHTKNRRNIKKTLIISVAILVVAVLVYGAVAHGLNIWPFKKDSSTTSKPASTNNTSTGTTKTSGTASTASTDATKSAASTETTDQIPVNTSSVATIDTLVQKNGYINFSASVTNTGDGGTCSVVFSNPNAKPVVVDEFKATINGTTATCAAAPISEGEFTYLGDWTATFRYYLNDQQATTTRTITIQ